MSMSLRRKVSLREQAMYARATEKRLAGISRAGQVARSTVPVGESDLPVVETLESAVDVVESLPGVVDTADQAGSDAYEAWDQSEFAKNLAEELGVNVGELTDEVSAAASAAAAAQGAADAAQFEAETARSEATSKSAAAEAAAKAHADAEAEAARLAAVAAASGDATAKADAAEAAAKAAAAADASAKANAAEAAAKADAAAAQSTANDAAAAAAAAQSAAGDASALASQAQATASGKNKTYRDTSAPSGSGSAAGDRWERYDTLAAGGKLQGTWAWSGSAWVSTVLSETYLPLVNIGSGTYGTLAGARLAATAIDGMTITGAFIRTALTGQRWEMNLNGLTGFDANNAKTVQLLPGGGGMMISDGLSTHNARIQGDGTFYISKTSGTVPVSMVSRNAHTLLPDPDGVGYERVARATMGRGTLSLEALEDSGGAPGEASPRKQVINVDVARPNGPEIMFHRDYDFAADETHWARISLGVNGLRIAGEPGLDLETPTTVSGNSFSLKSQLNAWAPIDGTHAWVTSEGREYVRAGGAWQVAYENTAWASLSFQGGHTGTIRWRRYMGMIQVQWECTSTIAADALVNPLFVVPLGIAPTMPANAVMYGNGGAPYTGRISSNQNAQVRNNATYASGGHTGWCEYPAP